jgi:hypothetical protein
MKDLHGEYVRRKEDYSSAKGAKVKYMKDHTDIVVIIFIPHPVDHHETRRNAI